MQLTLKVWRQASPLATGRFETYSANDVSPDMSFLEMLDVVNEQIVGHGKRPIAFDHDCREGICGACGMMIDGVPHGPQKATAACQLYMRTFHDGDIILIEPWRARAFPLIQDLMVDRGAFDRIIQAGGYVDVHAGGAPDANDVLIGKAAADHAMDAAACIGCGACVAACPNASASLFVAAKISHLGLLPQGQPERDRRAVRMVEQMDLEGFGNCGWYGECQAACPKEISIDTIVQMDRDYTRAMLSGRGVEGSAGRPGRRAIAASIDEPAHKPNADAESVLGGADAVEKTTYVVGDGTDPSARTPIGRPPGVGSTWFNPLLWLLVLIAALVSAVYVFGIGR